MDYANFRKIPGTKLYRASRPDELNHNQRQILEQEYGIKCIIDLRSPRESLAMRKNVKPQFSKYERKYRQHSGIFDFSSGSRAEARGPAAPPLNPVKTNQNRMAAVRVIALPHPDKFLDPLLDLQCTPTCTFT